MSSEWRKCAVCKKIIPLGGIYQSCSISSCKKHVFCSVDCWDVHSGVMGHKSAWAEEERAPMQADSTDDSAPRRRLVDPSKSSQQSSTGVVASNTNQDLPHDILIVVSKLKSYIQAKSGMNTSADVADILSDLVRFEVGKAIEKARSEGRKTVMARDFN